METWYKDQKKRKRDEWDEEVEPQKRKRKNWQEGENTRKRVAAVMFVPYTPRGELAKRLREAEKDLENQTGIRVKIVERTGIKMIDLLHKADPWIGKDCERQGCLL